MLIHIPGFPGAVAVFCSHLPYCEPTVSVNILAEILKILVFSVFAPSLRENAYSPGFRADLQWLILWLIYGEVPGWLYLEKPFSHPQISSCWV